MRFRPGLLAIALIGCSAQGTEDVGDSGAVPTDSSATELKLGSKMWVPLTSDTPVEPQVSVNGDQLVMRLGGYFVESATVKNEKYVRISVPGHSSLSKAGFPELPKVRVNVPSSDLVDAAYEVIEQNFEDVASNPPLPARGEITRNIDPNTVPYQPGLFYKGASTYPAQNVEIGESFYLRHIHGTPVQFQPFQYDAGTKSLRVFSEIRVRVAGAAQDAPQVLQRGGEYEEMYASAFAGASPLPLPFPPLTPPSQGAGKNEAQTGPTANPEVAEPGRLLVITADAYAEAIAPLVDWKIRRGLTTTVKKMSEIGTTAAQVQAFIKAEFESAASLTYVILVGDANTIPTLQGGYEKADCDPCFAMVKGNDYYPDLFISRISGRTVEQIETQVAKFVAYERTPDAAGEWYNRAAGIASNEGSPKDWERMEDLRKAQEAYGYAPNAKIYDPSAKIQQVNDEVSKGLSLLNYMGHGSGTSWSTTGFSVRDVQKLTNVGKWPFIIDVACMNGAFVDLEPAFAEAWLRQGTKEAPAGAISMYSASTNAAWVPPTVMQAWAVKELLIKEKRNTVGSLAFGGAARVLETYPNGDGQMLVEQYNIFGDATLVLRTKAPKALSATQALTNAGSDVTVTWADGTPAAKATVALSQNGTVLAVSVTDDTGVAKLTHAAAAGAALTVTAYNAIPFESQAAAQ